MKKNYLLFIPSQIRVAMRTVSDLFWLDWSALRIQFKLGLRFYHICLFGLSISFLSTVVSALLVNGVVGIDHCVELSNEEEHKNEATQAPHPILF
jgi:hypothetical protein